MEIKIIERAVNAMLEQNDLFLAFPSIQTKRLHLRQIVAADAEDLYSFYKDPKFIKYLDWDGPGSIEECAKMIDSWNRSYEAKRLLPWGIAWRNNNKLIGTVMFMPLRGTFEDTPRFPFTIGYDLKRELWNKGIMTEALQAALDFCTKKIGPHRVQAEVLPGNTASIKLLKKLGFREEGLLHHYLMHERTKTFLNVVVLALLLN
ncbi:GNAT family N-acetyltransferase [Cohnella sp. CFH 77786]|uniref:GNAT family N-acetyltransferase n=1 Tax=Cohnella sp. CFH 77786 TaxID=2662265 RepID=UPI001C60D6BD|nr:GNAT family N-acetyltransferase [Cohnella sp. CFH 77786]